VLTPKLLEAVDRFLEAAQNVQKWRKLRPAFKKITPAIGKAFVAQGKALLAADLVQGSWLETWDKIAEGKASDGLLDAVQAAATAGLEVGAGAMAQQFEIDTAFNLKNPRAVAYLKVHGAELVTGINETTRSRIQTIIAEGAERGLSYDEIADMIADAFAQFAPPGDKLVDLLLGDRTRSRAEIVAITELGMAYEAGNAIVIDDLEAGGLKMQKKWLTVGDGNVSDICRGNAVQGWIDVDEDFQSGHATPLGHPLCRCTALYRRKPK
jgi:hypothetical protein